MKTTLKYVAAGFIMAGVILTVQDRCKEAATLEQKLGINATMSEFVEIKLPKNHIDPNKLQSYKTDYDAPMFDDSVGEITDAKLGYYGEDGFVVPTDIKQKYLARHIQKPADIFEGVHPSIPDYYLSVSVKKPGEKRNEDYMKKFSKGLKLKSGILIFPVLNYGTYCEFESPDIILTWNTDIDGLYKDPNAISWNPQHYLHYVKNVKELCKH